MPSAPSRNDVENLHRQMMQASADASQHEKRLQEEQKTDGLSGELRQWHDAADAISGAVERVKTDLLRDGTAKEHVERIGDRLKELKSRAKSFDVQTDLDGCVAHWKALGDDFSKISGKNRDALVKLLESRRGRIDQVTATLSQARKVGGLSPEKYRKVNELKDQRDRARKSYEELRQKYLQAERDFQAAERQKQVQAASAEQKTAKAPIPNLASLQQQAKKGPVLVRLPDPKAADKTAQTKLSTLKPAPAKPLPPPPPKPVVAKPKTEPIKSGVKPDPKKAAPGVDPKKAAPGVDPKKPVDPKKVDPKKPVETKKTDAGKKPDDKKTPAKPGEKKPQTPAEKIAAEKKKAEEKKLADKKAAEQKAKDAKKAPPKPGQVGYGKPQPPLKPGQKPVQVKPQLPSNRPPALIKPGAKGPAQHLPAVQHASTGAHKASGPAKISLERTEKVAGYPTGVDGIGRGGQTASIFFRAENFPDSLSIQGTTSLQLGCAVRLDVMPSVQLFSATQGAQLKGKLSLMMVSSGGRLGTVSPASALEAAKTAAAAGARQVAGKLGVIGQQLSGAIADALEDAAEKIFRRAAAKAPQNKLPVKPAGPSHGKGPSTEHHVAKVNHHLGSILADARQARAPAQHTQKLLKHLDRDHHARDSVAGRLETTLSHLATATHRTLTDKVSGEMRSQLARMDAILSRVKGKRDQLEQGAHEIGDILARMSALASSKGGAGANIAEFRKLIDERKGALKKIVGETQKAAKAPAAFKPIQLGHSIESALAQLRKGNPGLDKLLKNASQSQLSAELAKFQKQALSKMPAAAKALKGGLGSGSLAGGMHALGGAHLGGFGGGHRQGALGNLAGMGGALSKALEKQLEAEIRRAKPGDIGKVLAGMHKAPKGTAIHELAKKAEEKQKRLATKKPHKGPMPAQMTAEALLDVLKDHPKGKGVARHFAKGGELYTLCQAAQRGHGLQVGQAAQHYLSQRGHSNVFNAVSTFNGLIKAGHKPHRWGLGSIGHFVSSAVSKVSSTVSKATSAVSSFASNTVHNVASGISDFGHRAMDFGRAAVNTVSHAVQSGVGAARNVVSRVGHAVGSAAHRVGSAVSHAAHVVGSGVSNVAHRVGSTVSHVAHRVGSGISHAAHSIGSGISNVAHSALNYGSKALHAAGGYISSAAHGLWNTAKKAGHGVLSGIKHAGHSIWGGIKHGAHALSHVAKSGFHALQGAGSWIAKKAGSAVDYAKHAAGGAIDWAKHAASVVGDKVHAGLEWVNKAKTGVVGAIGSGLKKGFSFVKKAAEYTPLGLAIKAGKWAANGGLAKVWDKTKNIAGKAWAGVKTAYKATSHFLQSPIGQALVTGLSLAASFIPGGMLVKGIVGAGIGAITAISEGKDWKGILAGAAGGALTGALPFLKIGPLAKVGVGALQGGITALASGGNLKDCLKGAAGGALDSFDPGAFKALGKLKGFTAAEKLLKGGKLSKAEKEFMEASKFAGPLRGLEKAMTNPKARKIVGGLEKAGSKAVKGGIWVSGKAAKAQGVLDKVVGAGDKVHGVLSQVHDLAPGLADIVGDNPVGHFINNVGDLAGKGDDKLSKALEYGHTASDQLQKYRGYLDKGLGYAGVKDPAKAYEKMMARKDLAKGKKGGLEHVAKLKLEDHRKKHPELHLAEATGKRTRGEHGTGLKPRKRPAKPGTEKFTDSHGKTHGMGLKPAKRAKKTSPHDAKEHEDHPLPKKPKGGNKPKTKLEQALAKGKSLIKKGQKVAQGVHDGLGKVQGVVEKGLSGAQKVQSGLEQAQKLAKLGAGLVGEDTELGKFLLESSEKAEQVHGYLETGIGFAEEFNKGIGKAHELTGKIPGVHDGEGGEGESEEHGGGKKKKPKKIGGGGHDGTPEHLLHGKGGKTKHKAGEGGHDGTPEHLQHGKDQKPSPHDTKKPVKPPKHDETEAEKSARLKQAWDKLATVSRTVQDFETRYGKTQAKIQDLIAKGKANEASFELMGLGSECDSINKYIEEAKTLSKGHDGYTKEAKFYEEWHKKTKAKLHAAIADTKGLGSQVAISGFGITEQTHPDIFKNTRDIYAVSTKVEAFGEALSDHDAADHVKKVLAEAKKAKSDLGALKTKYKKDKAAYKFLTDHGTQDAMIDKSIAKLEAALKGEGAKKPTDAKITKKDPAKTTDKKKPGVDVHKKVDTGLKALKKYKQKALKAGKKVDSSLGKLEHALGKGIQIGKKVDGGLEKVAGLADQVAGFFGDDSEVGHFAHQVGEGASKGHEKLHDALNVAQKGKKGLHKGHEIFHQGLEAALGHHEKKIEKVHGKKPAGAEHQHGGASHAELVKHATAHEKHKKSPHGGPHVPAELEHLAKDGKHFVDDAGHLYKDGKKIVHDGKKFVTDAKHAGKDAEHMFHDGQKMWKTGKKSVHDAQKGVKDLKHGFGDVKSLWGHLKEGDFKGALGDGKHLLKDGKGLVKDGKTLIGDGKKLFGQGKHLFEEGKHLFGEGKHLWGEAKNLFGEGKHIVKGVKGLVKDGKHVIGDVSHLLEKGKDWVHANLHKLDLGGIVDQAKGMLHKLPDWLGSIFGGGKKSPHDPEPAHHKKKKKKEPHHGTGLKPKPEHGTGLKPKPAPGPHKPDAGGGFSEADIAQVVHGALGWVSSFGKAVTAAIKDIDALMKSGDTKKAGDRVQAVSVTSEQTRFEVTRAVSTSAKYPKLAKQAKEASKHYLEIRKHFFDFVQGLHGLAGQTQELEGVDPKKYPDLFALSTDINSLQVKVDSLGDLKHADTPMQAPVKDLQKEASGLRSRVDKAKGQYKKDPAASQVVEGLSAKLQQIEKQLGAHTQKSNVAKGDKDLGIPPAPKPKPHKPVKPPKKPDQKPTDTDDHRINVDQGGNRGDMGGQDGQDVDPAAMDTWIGSGEGVKLFSEVFGAFLPAEGAVVHHGHGKHHGKGKGGLNLDVHGGAHGSVSALGGLVHAQGGIGGALHAHAGMDGIDVSGKGHAGGAVDIGGLHLGGGVSGHGAAHIGLDGIHLEGGLDIGVNIAGHKFGAHLGGKFDLSTKKIAGTLSKLKGKATGFFKGLFDHLSGFASTIGKWAKIGGGLLGKGMHFAEMGMHGLSAIEKASSKVEAMAGKAEGFLNKMGLGKLAGVAGKIGGAAGWVGKESTLLHGGLKTADKYMGEGKKVAGQVAKGAAKAGGVFNALEHGKFGVLANLFKSSKSGDGMDGRLVPEKMRLGSHFDEPRRLDLSTMGRMEGFLGGDLSGVRIHTGPGAAQITQRYNAEAVTVKDHIFFAPGRFNPGTTEGQRLLAHELTHVLQKGRPNLDVRTAESEALHSEHTFGYGNPSMTTLNLSQPAPDFRLGDGEGVANTSGVYTAKRNRSRGHETGGKDTLPDGEEFIEQISDRVYEILMDELEHSFESR